MPITQLQPFNLDTTSAYTMSQLTVTGNITSGNINLSGNLVDTGALTIISGSNGNITLAPNGTGIVSVSAALSASGNINLSGTGARIISDFSNATVASRTMFQTSTANSFTAVMSMPSGTGVSSGFTAFGGSDPGNAGLIQIAMISASEARLSSAITGTGTYANLTFFTGGSERMKIDTNGNVTANVLLSVAGNVTGGNLLTGGLISATGRIFAASGAAGTPGITFSADTAQDTGFYWISDGNIGVSTNGTLRATFLTTGLSVVGNVTGGNIITAGLISATANVQAGNLRTAGLISATGAITGAAITGSSLTVSTGNVSAGNIVNTNANGVGNIGNATVYFNTVFGKATTAQYADLAEMYSADAAYMPGTVLDFGGNQEVTLSAAVSSNRVAGVVSTNPAHLMNSVLTGEYPVAVALTGRVPTSVTGTVSKGDMMVSGGNGVAVACARPEIGTVIGKALENFSGESGVIEIVVGRL